MYKIKKIQKHMTNKKSELMLMKRARGYSSSCSHGNLGLSPPVSSQFTVLQPKIAKNY